MAIIRCWPSSQVKLKKALPGRQRSKHALRPRGDLAMDWYGFAKVQVSWPRCKYTHQAPTRTRASA